MSTKYVNYRRVANKLRTKNRDLSRHKRCQAFDRAYGNNGGSSVLGVTYEDSDGDGYKDRLEKVRRARSLYRDPTQYGGSQAIRSYYSRKVTDSAAPAVEREFKNVVVLGKAPRNPVIDKLFADSGMYGSNTRYWDTYLDIPAGRGLPYFLYGGIYVTLHGPDVSVAADGQRHALLSLTLNGTISDPTAATANLKLSYGTGERFITGTAYDPNPGTRNPALPFDPTDDDVVVPGTLLFSGGASYTSFTVSTGGTSSGSFASGVTVSKSIESGLAANTTYYYAFHTPNDEYNARYSGPLQSFTTL